MSADLHQEDLEFMATLKVATVEELRVLLRWQACEPWRHVAILRAIHRLDMARVVQ